MARVLCKQVPSRFGERSVMDRLSRLDEDWLVLYSLEFLDRHRSDRQRELDFLLLHPTRGAVFVEVKGGRVEFNDGVVRQWLEGDWKAVDPVNQLNGARRVALDYMKTVQDGLIPGRNVYVFPATERPDSGLSQELAVASIFSNELDHFGEIIDGWCPPGDRALDINGLEQLLTPCLTRDAGVAAHKPGSDRAAAAPAARIRSLTDIKENQGRTFSSLDEARAMLTSHRAALQQIWDDVALGTSEIEDLSGDRTTDDSDLFSSLLRETESLLASERVEVGVFGQVKRGKSTLVNALVGREVSAVGMLPKTAVPVDVEWAEEESGWIQLADGSSKNVPVEGAIEATTQGERKRREKEGLPAVDRVSLRLPLDWLPPNVRLVDTPGLSDPSMVDDYENFARAELERVAAGVLVICYPPGPDEHESTLIRNLARFGIAKLFFVVNMWSDVWNDPSARIEISEYLTDLLRAANEQGAEIDESDIRVLPANLKAARDAQTTSDVSALKESGLPEIKRLVESFLTEGALGRISTASAQRLLQVARLITTRLQTRLETINNPQAVERMRADLEQSIAHAERTVDSIMDEVEVKTRALVRELEAIAAEPYNWARQLLANGPERSRLHDIEGRLALRSATSASKLTAAMTKRASTIIADARTVLIDQLSVTSWVFSPDIDTDSLFVAEFNERFIEEHRPASDYRAEAKAGSTLIGAMLGGGGGVALAATGPIGLLVGALIGYAFGDTIGSMLSDPGNSDTVSQKELAAFRAAIDNAERQSKEAVHRSVDDLNRSIRASLESQKGDVLGDARRELNLVERTLGDSRARSASLAQIKSALATVAEISG